MFVLRRSMPAHRFDELLAELVEVAPRYQLDEVMVMVEAEELFPGLPTPETVRDHVGRLERVRDALAPLGIAYSLNPWVTHGHEDRRRINTVPGMRNAVKADGTAATSVCCLLSPSWRANLVATWHLYASTRPHAIWVEDDIRDFGHYECYCPLHLERFSAFIDQSVTREELLEAILRPGAPHPWRAPWLELRAQGAREAMEIIRETVRSASPDTRIGLMSSGPRNHCREGRDWHRVAEALGGEILSRPTMGNYWEWSPPRGLYFSQDSIKLTRHALPAGTPDFTEIENVPFTRYAKSVSFMNAALALSFAYGARGVTLNIFDHLGTPMEDEPHYGRLLAARKAFLASLSSRAQRPGALRGLGLIHRKHFASTVQLAEGATPASLAEDGYPALEAFEAAGIPTIYDDSPATFLCGRQAWSLDDAEIAALLAQGLFVDGLAAAILCERGYAADLGLSGIQAPQSLESLGAFAAESLEHPDFGGAKHRYLTAQLPMVDYSARFAILDPLPGSTITGHLITPSLQAEHPAMTAFENARGGRVVVHAWDYASAVGPIGVSFHHPHRVQQLQAAVKWLFRGHAPLLVQGDGAWPLALRHDAENASLLGFFNLSLDPWSEVTFTFAAPSLPVSISVLRDDGQWEPIDPACCFARDGIVSLTWQKPVALTSPLFLDLRWI